MRLLLAKVVYHCIIFFLLQANLMQTKHELGMLQKEKYNEVCVSALMYFSILSLPHHSLFYGLFFSSLLFQHIFNIVVPSRGQIHHLALLLKP